MRTVLLAVLALLVAAGVRAEALEDTAPTLLELHALAVRIAAREIDPYTAVAALMGRWQ